MKNKIFLNEKEKKIRFFLCTNLYLKTVDFAVSKKCELQTD